MGKSTITLPVTNTATRNGYDYHNQDHGSWQRAFTAGFRFGSRAFAEGLTVAKAISLLHTNPDTTFRQGAALGHKNAARIATLRNNVGGIL
jgi:hypothetical protein